MLLVDASQRINTMPQNRREREAMQANRSGRKSVRIDRGQQPGASAADRSAVLSDRVWRELISHAVYVLPAPAEPEPELVAEPATGSPRAASRSSSSRSHHSYEPTGRERKALKRFYTHAAAGDVSCDHIDEGVAKAFCADKWPARCDKMAMALLCYADRSVGWPIGADMEHPGTLQVASVGGGPANDACGSFIFASLLGSSLARVEATVFDFTSVWEPFCERIADVALLGNLAAMLADAAAPEPEPEPEQGQGKQAKAEPQPAQHRQNQQFALSFALADLRAPPSAAINDTLLRSHTPTTDLFLFSHVVRESAACEHDLLPAILRSCKRGAVLVFLDMQWSDLHTVQELVTRVEAEDAAAVAAAAARPSTTRFEVMRVGESQEYPMFGLVFRKLSS